VVIGSTIVAALDALNLRFPRVDKASLEEFAKVRDALQREGEGKGKGKSKSRGKNSRNKGKDKDKGAQAGGGLD